MLEVTHEGTTQVKETKTNMLPHEYELFTMKESESITSMLDRFTEITNGLASFGKPILESDRVKKILRSLPKEWDATVTAIMESKDLNRLEFSALVGSLLNYEIVLKSRNLKNKPKEKAQGIAFKVSRDENEHDRRRKDLKKESYSTSSKSTKARGMKKEAYIATWSDEDDDDERVETTS